ncbi:MAG: nickel pincer cofactor biosynthesis protein LarC [Sulfolobales archaeon]
MGKFLVLDPTVSGVSGDMLVSALIDLGGNPKILGDVSSAISKLPHVKDFRVSVGEGVRKGIRGKLLRVYLNELPTHVRGGEILNWFEGVANDLGLEGGLRNAARDTLITLLSGEALIHNSTPYEVHLHEVGSVDTLFDVVAFTLLLNDLKLYGVSRYSLPVAVGGGLVSTEHGVIPSPAYITLELLKSRNYYLVGGPVGAELTTPTGAAILTTFFKPIKYLPLMKVVRVGYGCGSKEFKEVPNVVRVILGDLDMYPDDLAYDEVYLLESNVDDVTGEVIGYSLERFMSLGALDVSVIPVTTKKGRPGYVVRVLSDEEHVQDLVSAMVRELGTLGVRISKTSRCVVPHRELRDLRVNVGKEFIIRVKVCRDGKGNVVRVKPEFDDLKSIAEELNLSIRELLERVLKEL